jgi:hypothetical protein
VSVRVAEVAGVDAPGAVAGLRHGRAGGSRLLEDPVDVGPARDQLTKAEPAALRRGGRDCRILRELGARVEREQETALEREDDDGARRARLLVDDVGCDDALRSKTEAVAIERESTFEVVDGERDDVEARVQSSVPFGRRSS